MSAMSSSARVCLIPFDVSGYSVANVDKPEDTPVIAKKTVVGAGSVQYTESHEWLRVKVTLPDGSNVRTTVSLFSLKVAASFTPELKDACTALSVAMTAIAKKYKESAPVCLMATMAKLGEDFLKAYEADQKNKPMAQQPKAVTGGFHGKGRPAR